MKIEWRAFETTQACVGHNSPAGNISNKKYKALKLEELSVVDLLRSSRAKSRQIHPHIASACCWHSLDCFRLGIGCVIKFHLLNLTFLWTCKSSN